MECVKMNEASRCCHLDYFCKHNYILARRVSHFVSVLTVRRETISDFQYISVCLCHEKHFWRRDWSEFSGESPNGALPCRTGMYNFISRQWLRGKVHVQPALWTRVSIILLAPILVSCRDERNGAIHTSAKTLYKKSDCYSSYWFFSRKR